MKPIPVRKRKQSFTEEDAISKDPRMVIIDNDVEVKRLQMLNYEDFTEVHMNMNNQNSHCLDWSIAELPSCNELLLEIRRARRTQ